MTANTNDNFYKFIDLYESNQVHEALQLILLFPDVAYDELVSKQSEFRYLINYTDASVFKGLIETIDTIKAIESVFASNKLLAISTETFISKLSWIKNFIHVYLKSEEKIQNENSSSTTLDLLKHLNFLKQSDTISEQDIDQFLLLIPSIYQSNVSDFLKILKNWKNLKSRKPILSPFIEEKMREKAQIPWYTINYKLNPRAQEKLKRNATPLIFLEPLANVNYKSLLAPYIDEKALFVFETVCHFLQILQFPDMIDILSDPNHFIYILDLYPQQQIHFQSIQKANIVDLQAIFITERKVIEEVIPLLKKALIQCLDQKEQDFNTDTLLANWLYQICQRLLFRIQTQRYGSSRYIALSIQNGYRKWFDSNKGNIPSGVDLGPAAHDDLKERLNQLNAQRQVRPFQPKNKIKLAHVVPQVVSLGHAPTRLLTNLISYADHSWFDISLISTERLVNHPLDYPSGDFASSPSYLLANELLEYFHSIPIRIHIESQITTYEATAQNVAKLLQQLQSDIVIFHGTDEVNCLCSCLSDVPIRVMLEHGSPPTYPCFDLAILSTEDTWKQNREEYHRHGMESCALHFCINVRERWEDEPYSKKELGFPEDSFIMTTISNHLKHRLSLEMCQAIAEILQRCPNAYYAPIGGIDKEDLNRLNSFFETYHVKDRVIFLGSKSNPSQYARSMNLYLNEFPFGSCLGMLDAMAAGCPVVSMYDENGIQQAKYGGIYFGLDRVITNGKKEDYINLACALIQNKEMYQEWSNHANAQYEKQADEVKYVKRLEKILESFIEYIQSR